MEDLIKTKPMYGEGDDGTRKCDDDENGNRDDLVKLQQNGL